MSEIVNQNGTNCCKDPAALNYFYCPLSFLEMFGFLVCSSQLNVGIATLRNLLGGSSLQVVHLERFLGSTSTKLY